jgi:hypothetical protein
MLCSAPQDGGAPRRCLPRRARWLVGGRRQPLRLLSCEGQSWGERRAVHAGCALGESRRGRSLGCLPECSDVRPRLSARRQPSRRGGPRGLSTRAVAGWGEDTVPQERTAGTAIALALEQLQPVDMARNGAVAPRKRAPRGERCARLPPALGKAGQRLTPARRRRGPPGLQGVAPALPQERQERLAPWVGWGTRRGSLPPLVKIARSLRRPLGWRAPPGERARPR